jgi:hypothetical protein
MLLKDVLFSALTLSFCFAVNAQTVADQNKIKLQQALEKKAEYHRLTNGEQDGYRIKIHFGVDKEQAEGVRTKFGTAFPDYMTYREYQQPNFVILVGDFRTKLEAFEVYKKIKADFPNSFIVKGKIILK